MKKHGFTLAETLITLTIIGVVAAMTIPTLMSKYQKHTYVVGLKKNYAQMKYAMQMLPLAMDCPAGDYDCVGLPTSANGAGSINYREMMRTISKILKSEKYCYAVSDKGCEDFKDHYLKYINSGNYSPHTAAILLADGSIIFNRWWDYVYVDVNGFKGPNKVGRDIFAYYVVITEKNNIPVGSVLPIGSKAYANYTGYYYRYWRYNNNANCNTQYVNNSNADTGGWVHTCTGRVLEEDAMNY